MVKLLSMCCGVALEKGELCKCIEIGIIRRFVKYCCNKYRLLVPATSTGIRYKDINAFNNSGRANNDSNNKMRECIVDSIINDIIPKTYYTISRRWNNLREEINLFIEKLCVMKNVTKTTQSCKIMAGRKHHYDFKVIVNGNVEFYVEFKFNTDCVDGCPQFVSPMKPSQYLESSYEDYYYENYLKKLVEEYGFPLPDKEVYLGQIHSTTPECVLALQDKYKKGYKTTDIEHIAFYKRCKELSKTSIKSFIQDNSLNIERMSKYLIDTQKNKYYMLYKNGKMNLQKLDSDDYEITSYYKEPELQRYRAVTKKGVELKLLLRWKNGNGIAYPAFQIS